MWEFGSRAKDRVIVVSSLLRRFCTQRPWDEWGRGTDRADALMGLCSDGACCSRQWVLLSLPTSPRLADSVQASHLTLLT